MVNSDASAMPDDLPVYEDQYYATLPPDKLCEELVSQVERVRTARRLSFLANRLRRNWMMYYGLDDGAARLDDNLYPGGVDGSTVRLRANHYRNILQHMLVMTTNTRPTLDCKAANTDEKSISQTTIANAVIEHYLETQDVWRFIDRAVEQALLLTAGFVHVEWDASAGHPYAVSLPDDQPANDAPPPMPPEAPGSPMPGMPPGQPPPPQMAMPPAPPPMGVPPPTNQPSIEDLIFEGDLKFTNPTLFDVFFDQSLSDFDSLDDVTVRSWMNRYDLMARFPDLTEKIREQETKKQWNNVHLELPCVFYNPYETNLVEVFTYYHRKSAAVPKGRMSILLADGTCLYDGDLPYSRIPLFRCVASDMIGTPQGYSPATDIASLQEACDRLISALFTNNATFAVQNIAIPRGANIQVTALDSGLNAMHYNETGGPSGGLPSPLQLTKSPPEAYTLLETMVHMMESISGINSVARGNPPPGMDAGVALSLVQTMAIQFMNGLQKSYAGLLRDLGYFMIDTLKTYAQTQRLIAIVGKSKQSQLKEFSGADLEGIARVTVDLGNPLSRTVAGRMQIAKALVDTGMAISPKQYLEVLESGRLEPITEAADAQLNLIRAENEALMEGKPVSVLPGDDDQLHMKEHLALLSNPDVRNNAPYLQGTIAHVEQHKQKYLMGDDILGVISGMLAPGSAGPHAAPPADSAGPGSGGHGGKGAAPHSPPPHQPEPQRRSPAPAGPPPGILPMPNFPAPPPAPPA